MGDPNLDLGLEFTGGITKPAPEQITNLARVTVDAYGAANLEYSEKYQTPRGMGNASSNGDAAKTLTVGAANSWQTQTWATPLTANRTVTLSNTNAYDSAKFRIRRTAAATGAFNLVIGITGKNLAAGQWCDVEYDGTNWNVTAFGSL